MITIRTGTKKDLPSVFQLVRELAIYENGLDQVSNTVEKMEVDGFGENPIYGLIVAEADGEVIGSAIYYYRYSTWKGKRMYLEDLIVTETKRGGGAGKMLFDEIIKIARETDCSGMMWQVLDWNEPCLLYTSPSPRD